MNKIFENFQYADQDSIEQPPLFMRGINRTHAQELASNRLRTWEVNENKIQEFLDPRWLVPNHYDVLDGDLHKRRFRELCRRVLGQVG